jgi:hypothetical protein
VRRPSDSSISSDSKLELIDMAFFKVQDIKKKEEYPEGK